MAGIVPVFIFLDEASIYAFLDLAFYLVDLALWGGVWTLSYHRSFELWFELRSISTSFLQDRGRGNITFYSDFNTGCLLCLSCCLLLV